MTNEMPLAQSDIRQDPMAKLLLLTAKPTLNAQQIKEASQLSHDIQDWDLFVTTATRKFSVTYAYRALSECDPSNIPKTSLDQMRGLAKKTGLNALKIAAAQVSFHKSCIEPTGAKHAYLKGVALSIQNKQKLSDRFCRDIDVLIAENQMQDVVWAAHRAGYRILMTVDPVKFAETDRDIQFVSRFAGVVMLLSPENVLIEVHRRIDKGSLKFDLHAALNETEVIELSGVKMQTLAKPLHFVYACYHHARHYWSHLHWLADLDAMITAEGFDRHAVLVEAEHLGIQPTIEAAMEFHCLISRSGLWQSLNGKSELALDFLKACLINLEGGLELEYQLRENKYLSDFISASQITPKTYNATGKIHWSNKLIPNIAQYLKRPYPEKLFWVYRVEMAYILIRDALGLKAQKDDQVLQLQEKPSDQSPPADSER